MQQFKQRRSELKKFPTITTTTDLKRNLFQSRLKAWISSRFRQENLQKNQLE